MQLFQNIFAFFSCMQIIVLEDTEEYISYAPKEVIKAQDRRPFDLLVCPSAQKGSALK